MLGNPDESRKARREGKQKRRNSGIDRVRDKQDYVQSVIKKCPNGENGCEIQLCLFFKRVLCLQCTLKKKQALIAPS